jgi:hypothetical protein
MSNNLSFRLRNFGLKVPPPVKKATMKTYMTPYTYIHPDASIANLNPTFPPQTFNGSQLLSLYNVPVVRPSAGKKQVKIAIIIAYTYSGLLTDLKTAYSASQTALALGIRHSRIH